MAPVPTTGRLRAECENRSKGASEHFQDKICFHILRKVDYQACIPSCPRPPWLRFPPLADFAQNVKTDRKAPASTSRTRSVFTFCGKLIIRPASLPVHVPHGSGSHHWPTSRRM